MDENHTPCDEPEKIYVCKAHGPLLIEVRKNRRLIKTLVIKIGILSAVITQGLSILWNRL